MNAVEQTGSKGGMTFLENFGDPYCANLQLQKAINGEERMK